MKKSALFGIICEEGPRTEILWRGRIECFSDSAQNMKMKSWGLAVPSSGKAVLASCII
jgi:hypothetical protein